MSKRYLLFAGVAILLGLIGLAYMAFPPFMTQQSIGSNDSDFEYPFESDYRYKEFESNGEKIYYSGINESGVAIAFDGSSHWIYVHGGSCVNCHGSDATGGSPVMMENVIPPDIRYDTLISGEQHMNHVPYTEETLMIAIREGIDSEGLPLDLRMPRWRMMDEDVSDVIDYLKTL